MRCFRRLMSRAVFPYSYLSSLVFLCCSVVLGSWGWRKKGIGGKFGFCCCLLFCLPKVLCLSIDASFQQSTATARYAAGNR